MALTMLIEFRARPELWEEFKALVAELLPGTAAFDGCDLLHAAVVEDEHTIVFYEVWRDQASRDAYGEWRQSRGDPDRLARYMREPPVRRMATPIAVPA